MKALKNISLEGVQLGKVLTKAKQIYFTQTILKNSFMRLISG